MRRYVLAARAAFLVLWSAAAAFQQNTLPNPDDFIPAGPHCQSRVRVAAIVQTPAVNWPKTYRCELTFHTCQGVRSINSSERLGGRGMCDDYRGVATALAGRVICCDQGSREEGPQPAAKGEQH
jgi:hypothetical protein